MGRTRQLLSETGRCVLRRRARAPSLKPLSGMKLHVRVRFHLDGLAVRVQGEYKWCQAAELEGMVVLVHVSLKST